MQQFLFLELNFHHSKFGGGGGWVGKASQVSYKSKVDEKIITKKITKIK